MGIFTSSLSSQSYAVKPVSVTEDYTGVSMENFNNFIYVKYRLKKVVSRSWNDCCRTVDIQLTHAKRLLDHPRYKWGMKRCEIKPHWLKQNKCSGVKINKYVKQKEEGVFYPSLPMVAAWCRRISIEALLM